MLLEELRPFLEDVRIVRDAYERRVALKQRELVAG